MLDEIKKKYEKFSDSLITEIKYSSSLEIKQVEVTIKCMNALNDYNWELITLVFENVLAFQFKENEKVSSTIVNSALILKDENGIVLVDFFPLIYGNALSKNSNSDFLIKSKGLTYKLLDGK